MDYYDAIADGYDELHADEQLSKYRALASLGMIGSDDTILDIGHGSGLIAQVFGDSVIGIDSSARLLEASPCTTVLFDFNKGSLPFADESFDWVVSFTALHHARDPDALLAECERIARRGVAISLLRSLESYAPLSERLARWDAYPAGADTLFVLRT